MSDIPASAARIVTIVGARPQFVKAAVLRRAFDAHPVFHELLVHTGQHYDHKMSEVFFEELGIRAPDFHSTLTHRTHGAMTGEMLEDIERILVETEPTACLVYGDTNSTLAGALAASKLHIPVVHVEAGLRSFNKRMPEEINRILTDHVSDLLFCSTFTSIENLENENIVDGVHHVGDIMYDAVKMSAGETIETVGGVELGGRIAACTLHRAENTDDKTRFRQLLDYIDSWADTHTVVLPLHPRTQAAAERYGFDFGRIRTIEPVGYREMQALLGAADVVLTDSGGLQKEAYFHGVPCVTLREETEWVELVENGWNRLWRTPDYSERKPIAEYGVGDTGERIVRIMEERFLSESR